jgi:aminopeptidase N
VYPTAWAKAIFVLRGDSSYNFRQVAVESLERLEALRKNDINSDASGYLSGNPGWPIYNPSWADVTPPTGTLFNTAITYYKGACVLHMLRYTVGDPSSLHS